MQTEEGKAIYKERASTAECVNAQARNRGLVRLLVRGLQKVKAVALWHALAHNVRRAMSLRARLTLAAGGAGREGARRNPDEGARGQRPPAPPYCAPGEASPPPCVSPPTR